MNATELAYTSAADLAQLIRQKQLSAVEVTRATLERAQASQPVLNAFITICADQAMEAAKAADAAIMRDDTLGPLHGVPFTVKDLVNTKDVRTTFGSYVFENNIPKADQICVARLKKAGAILIGKTTTPEFGHKAITEAPLFGRTRNAWSAQRTSGGSSGGASVACASGIAPLAISTDGGGSTRIPAACNGVVGFKKTLGLVPHETAPDAFGNVSYIDPTTRTVLDNALMLEAMAGPHPSDPHSLYLKGDGLVAAAKGEGDLQGVRMVWRSHLGNTAVDTEVMQLCRQAFGAFADLKASVSETVDDFEPVEPVFQVLWSSLLNARYRQYVKEFGPRMSETLLRQMDQGVGADRRASAAGDLRAHDHLPQNPDVVRDRRHSGHADDGAHRRTDRSRFLRRRASSTMRRRDRHGARGIPTRIPLIFPGTQPSRCRRAFIPTACRSPFSWSADMARMPSCSRPPRCSRRRGLGQCAGPNLPELDRD